MVSPSWGQWVLWYVIGISIWTPTITTWLCWSYANPSNSRRRFGRSVYLKQVYARCSERIVILLDACCAIGTIKIKTAAGTDPAGKEGTVVGWGRTSEGGMLPGKMHEVQVPIYSLSQCRRMKYRANRITDNMICAGHGSQDSCQGDSGGPLLVQEADKLEIAGKTFDYSYVIIIVIFITFNIDLTDEDTACDYIYFT